MDTYPWKIIRAGRRWVIVSLTDEAGLLQVEVRTPRSFPTKRDAEVWVRGLLTHGI